MLKHVDPAGVLLVGGMVLAGIAWRYQWSERRLARAKA
jgi:hypothetical protein